MNTQNEILETAKSGNNCGLGDFYIIENINSNKKRIFWADMHSITIADAINHPEKGFKVVLPQQDKKGFAYTDCINEGCFDKLERIVTI